jgi:hypothetical protein
VIVSVPTKRGPEFVGFLAERDSPPFRIAGRECMHDFVPMPLRRNRVDISMNWIKAAVAPSPGAPS